MSMLILSDYNCDWYMVVAPFSRRICVLSLLMNYIVNWLLQLVGRQVASSVWHFVVCDILYSVLLLNCRCLSVVTVGW